MNPTLRRWLRLIIIVGLVLAVDQITKRLVVSDMILGETRRIIPFLSPLFQIVRSHNTGASFGLLPNAGNVFAVVAVIVAFVLISMYPRIPDEKRLQWLATGLIHRWRTRPMCWIGCCMVMWSISLTTRFPV